MWEPIEYSQYFCAPQAVERPWPNFKQIWEGTVILLIPSEKIASDGENLSTKKSNRKNYTTEKLN